MPDSLDFKDMENPYEFMPEIGSTIWWRGLRCEVVETLKGRGMGGLGLVRYRTLEGPFINLSNVSDMIWHEEFQLWYMPGVTGKMPHYNGTGEMIDPPVPRCANCGAVSWRQPFCTNCRNTGVR